MEYDSILKSNIYTIEKDGMGHTIINGVGIEALKISRGVCEPLLVHVVNEVKMALLISQKHGKSTSNVHLYLKGCSLKSFPLSLYKKIIKTLSDTFENTLNYCYIYDLSSLAIATWNCLKFFLDPVTRRKIRIIRTYK